MKIVCTQTEFAALIRACDKASANCECWKGCIFGDTCSRHLELYEGKTMTRIDDICEVIPESGLNG